MIDIKTKADKVLSAYYDEDNLPPEYSYGECYLYKCDTCKGVGYVPIEGY